MELQYLRQEALDNLSKSIANNIERYAKESSSWVDDYFQEEGIKLAVFSSEIEIEDIELVHGNDPSMDTENAIRFHKAMRGKLNAVQATDRRLWGALTHTAYYQYMHSRWPVENKLNDKNTNGTVTDRYFLSRGFFRNGIARLYWIPEMTFSSELEDPYEYTKYLIGKQDLINQIDGLSICRNRRILNASLKVLKKAEPLTEGQRRQFFNNLYKRGGVTVLDALPHEALNTVCNSAMKSVQKAKQIENGSIITVQAVDTGKKVQFEVRSGKPCLGKMEYRTVPRNLYRLTIGKKVKIGKVDYIIIEIE